MTTPSRFPSPLTDAVVPLPVPPRQRWLLFALVWQAIQQSNRPELADAFLREALEDDTRHLLLTCCKYVALP